MYLKLAWRNLFRKKARLAVTLAAVGFGCCSLIVSQGFIEHGLLQIQEQSIEGELGHMEIGKKGVFEQGKTRPADFVIENPDELVKAAQSVPHVKFVSPRLFLQGLLSNGDMSAPVRVIGLVPSTEAKIGRTVEIVQGRDLSDSDSDSVLLGTGLAKDSDARVDQPMILLVNTKFGAISGMDAVVKGVCNTGSRYVDDFTIRMNLPAAQKLAQVDGVTELNIFLDDTDRTDETVGRMRAAVGKIRGDLEVRPWYQIADYHQQTKDFVAKQFFLLEVIIVFIVILSVYNTLEMMVLDRVGEIGTMGALGFSSDSIVKMFMSEGVLLGLMGGLLGIALGIAVAWVVAKVGIVLPPPPGLTKKWYAHVLLTPPIVFYPFVLSFVTTVVSAVLPAYKAASLNVGDALRQNV
jgi:putative ABC transport system permease protein